MKCYLISAVGLRFAICIVWICRFCMVVIINSGGSSFFFFFFVKVGLSVFVFVVVL
jgi:uncharacterized protein YybS (DUF2232 family)